MSRCARLRLGVLLISVAVVIGLPGWPLFAQGGQVLTIQGFGGLVDHSLLEAAVKPFEARYGIRVVFTPGANSSAHITKLEAQRGHEPADLDLVDGGLWETAIAQGLYARLPEDRVPNLKDLYPIGRLHAGYGPAFGLASVVLGYQTEHVKTPPTSWFALWDPKYKGHVGMFNLDNTGGPMLLDLVAHVLGGSANDIAPAMKKFAALKRNEPTFFTQSPKEVQAFAQGDLWIAPIFNGQALNLIRSGGPLAVVYPKEGGIADPLAINIVAGTARLAQAAMFINYLLRPDVQVKFAELSGYAPVNAKAVLPPGLVAQTAAYGRDRVAHLFQPEWAGIAAHLNDWVTEWNQTVLR
jgi:putative spermidine/putrescine transport system substrate-binding protein